MDQYFKKVHRVIKFNREACLKQYIHLNTELGKYPRTDFKKDLFKLTSNGKCKKKRHKDINLVTTKAKRNYLVPAPIIQQFFSEIYRQ